ncbi:hypothetical protein D3C83_148930 [compost metagenome]
MALPICSISPEPAAASRSAGASAFHDAVNWSRFSSDQFFVRRNSTMASLATPEASIGA